MTAVIGEDILPVTYMNSTAGLKAFVGRHGGAVCTSSNARAVHGLGVPRRSRACCSSPTSTSGRNTGYRMGIPLDAMPVWDPYEDGGGLDADTAALGAGRALEGPLLGAQPLHARRWWTGGAPQIPGVKVIVHPECRFEVAQKADAIGSTEGILKTVRESPPGTKWAVGTELNMVNRLAREMAPETRQVVSLDDCFCVCSTMARIDPPHLLWVLEGLVEGEVREPGARAGRRSRARRGVALDRMLAIR